MSNWEKSKGAIHE